MLVRGEGSLFHHPNIRQVIFVSDSTMLQVAAKEMDSAPFGNVTVAVFDNIEEALQHVHSG